MLFTFADDRISEVSVVMTPAGVAGLDMLAP